MEARRKMEAGGACIGNRPSCCVVLKLWWLILSSPNRWVDVRVLHAHIHFVGSYWSDSGIGMSQYGFEVVCFIPTIFYLLVCFFFLILLVTWYSMILHYNSKEGQIIMVYAVSLFFFASLPRETQDPTLSLVDRTIQFNYRMLHIYMHTHTK